jgi:hypothetical protein
MTSENRETSYTNILKSNQQEVSLWNTRKGIRRLAIAPLLGIALTLVVMRSPELATGIVAAATALAGKGGRGDFAQDYLGARALLTGGNCIRCLALRLLLSELTGKLIIGVHIRQLLSCSHYRSPYLRGQQPMQYGHGQC